MGLPVSLRETASTIGVGNPSERRDMWRTTRVTSETQQKTADMQMPKRREGLIERELPEELILYDPETDRAFLLNRTSAAIWDLCDGQHSAEQIAREIAEHLSAPLTKVVEDVQQTIARLQRNRALVPS